MNEDPETLVGGAALGDAVERLRGAVAPQRIVAGWATVELDRAEIEVPARFADLGAPTIEDAPEDRPLGARCRRLRFGDGRDVLLLEPSTEGRLAAALARYGEGTLILYLVADPGAVERARRAGFTLTGEGHGPLGSERLVITGPKWGPFLVLGEG